MEMALLVVVVAVLAWFLGFFKPARQVADMATSEITKQSDAHKVKLIRHYANRANTVDVNTVKAAKANKALIDSFTL